MIKHRDYEIHDELTGYGPPFEWHHEDYDGPEDASPKGHGTTVLDCIVQIEEAVFEVEFASCLDCGDLVADCQCSDPCEDCGGSGGETVGEQTRDALYGRPTPWSTEFVPCATCGGKGETLRHATIDKE